jgi:uncharacterized membrane protein YphA (DoxX/SURF4 family)
MQTETALPEKPGSANPLDRYGKAIQLTALLLLCAAYLQGGVTKLADFNGAIAEVEHFNLLFAPAAAAATIVTQLVGSALVLTGFYRWLGALWLAGFTIAATLIAHRFWEMAPPERFFAANTFFEHLGLVGAFLLVAWLDLRSTGRTRTRSARDFSMRAEP